MGSSSLISDSDSHAHSKPAAPRRKQWAPKSKTGCITCKVRRIKCDEGRPGCWRCLSTSRRCDGYVNERPRRHPTPTVWPSPLLPGVYEENRHHHFFSTVTVFDLAGLFDSRGWTRNLLQISRTYPVLWHATAALGAMHQRFLSDQLCCLPNTSVDENIQFALKQFNAAITYLVKPLTERVPTYEDKVVVLTACVLFTCLCSLQGHQFQAFVHIRNGLKLLHEWKIREEPSAIMDALIPLDVLSTTLTHLDTQARTLHDESAMNSWVCNPVMLPDSSPPFYSFSQAYMQLESLFNGVVQAVRNPLAVEDAAAILESYPRHFAAWDARLADYAATLKATKHDKAISLLRIRRVLTDVALSHDPSMGELGYDGFQDHYLEILDLAATILDAQEPEVLDPKLRQDIPAAEGNVHPTVPRAKGRPLFTIITGVTESLYLVAARCRDPTIRRRALDLLNSHPRREGIWESTLAAKIAEAGMIVEERAWSTSKHLIVGACTCVIGTFICEGHRIGNLDITIVQDRQILVSMRTVHETNLGAPATEICFEW